MWLQREFRVPGEPYPHFTSNTVWSLVVVGIVAVFLLEVDVPLLAVAAGAAGVAAGMGTVLYKRVVEERTRRIRAANPRMATLMIRYGVAPRPRGPARLGA